MRINPRSSIALNVFVCQELGMSGSAGHCCGRHCASKRPNKTGKKKKRKKKSKAKSHTKPLAIGIDITAGVTRVPAYHTLTIKDKPTHRSHTRQQSLSRC